MIFIDNKSEQSLKDKIRYISKLKNVDSNIVLRFYLYDKFIERLSKSKYRNNFIIKGGFYLSTIFGLESRTTIDIDGLIRKIDFNDTNILKMINEIINIDVDDHGHFEIIKITKIREKNIYGGLRIHLLYKLIKMKAQFYIDLTTGDSIYPGPIIYKYESFISNDTYKILSYNLETVLAEKIESVLSKTDSTSRMKDYYDIYLIYKFKFDELDKSNLIETIKRTFKNRNFDDDIQNSYNIIKNSKELKTKWSSYVKDHLYARNIKFEETLECLYEIVEFISKNLCDKKDRRT